jgi:V/A-type H+-transporting ATPase subunit A
VDIDSFSEYDRQGKMLAMIRAYDGQCRAAAEKGGDLNELFNIPAREEIGRAKSVPADQYVQVYAAMEEHMEQQINAIAEKGADEL